jgi:hypothetical protein
MNPEDPKDRNEECGHHNENPIEHWLPFRIIMSGMGKPHHEICIRPGVAFSTSLYQTAIRDERFGIIWRKDAVETVTVRTSRHQFWVTQMLNLPVVTFIIGLSGDEKDLIPFHHLLVGMAFLADLGMELLTKIHHFWFVTF